MAATLLKVEFRLVPIPLAAATMATAIKLAINAYSIAVAPVSSRRNWVVSLLTLFSTGP